MSLKGKIQDFKILRGEGDEAGLEDFSIELDEGMVVLDCVHRIQHEQQPDMPFDGIAKQENVVRAQQRSTVVLD